MRFIRKIMWSVGRFGFFFLVCLLRRHPSGEVLGIRVVDLKNYDGSEEIRSVMAAIRTIEEVGGRWISFVQNYCNYVVILSVAKDPGEYVTMGRFCILNPRRLKAVSQTELEHKIAGILVHEAMHGWLISRGLRTTKRNQLRIERLCYSRQLQFMKRLPDGPKYAEHLAERFRRLHAVLAQPGMDPLPLLAQG